MIALIVVGIVVYIVYDTNLIGRTQYHNVTVSGSVSTVGFGTTPFRIDFTNPDGTVSSASVSNGQYTIILTNNVDYAVTVDYSDALGSSSCNGGAFNLSANSPTVTYNTSC